MVGGLEIEYFLDSVIGELLFLHGEFESAESDLLCERLSKRAPGAVFLDVGANIGLHSLAVARAVPTARIFSFEPGRATFATLERNIARSGFGGVARALPLAIAAQPGRALFQYCADNAYSSLQPDERSPVALGYEVEVVTLDQWVAAAGLDRVDLLKVDVEGGEKDVIEGARRILAYYHPELLVEIYQGKRTHFSATRLIADICAFGYDPSVLVNGVWLPFKSHDDAHFNYHFVPKGVNSSP
jgi:FkbM family methyltransferase